MWDVCLCVCLQECVFVCHRLKWSHYEEEKNACEEESGWGAEMIRPPTDDSAPSQEDLLRFQEVGSSVLSKFSQQQRWLGIFGKQECSLI